MAALFLWLFFAAGSTTPYTSDAAGNAMAAGFVMLSGFALWVLLAVLMLLAGLRGGLAPWTIVAAIVLVPASGAAALRIAELFAKASSPPKWLAVVPIAAPGLECSTVRSLSWPNVTVQLNFNRTASNPLMVSTAPTALALLSADGSGTGLPMPATATEHRTRQRILPSGDRG